MKRYICREAGCPALLESPGYCDKHKRDPSKRAKPFENAVRSNQGLYNSRPWRELKTLVLKEQPYCYFCGISKEDAGGLDVHHLSPPRGDSDLFFDRNNIVPVCRECHERLTAREIQERKKR